MDEVLGGIRRRAAIATGGVVTASLGAAVALAAEGHRSALLPVSFLLGWLNLVGL